MCKTMNIAAGRSAGRSASTRCKGSKPPAEAPITMTSGWPATALAPISSSMALSLRFLRRPTAAPCCLLAVGDGARLESLQQAQPGPNHFAGGLIAARRDQLLDEALKVRCQRDIQARCR